MLACLLAAMLCGCRVAVLPLPNGKTAFAASLLTEPHVEIRADGSVLYGSPINVPATTAMTTALTSLAQLLMVMP